MHHPFLRRGLIALAALAVLAAGACGGDDATTAATSPATATAPQAQTAAFPLTVDDCGEAMTLEATPERVVILGSDPVALLAAVGALDRVVAKTSDVPPTYYDAATNDALAAIPTLDSSTGPTGGAQISAEAVIDQQPDLVIGYETETITRAGLAAVGIPLYVIPAYCPDGTTDGSAAVSFDDVYRQVDLYGEMFDAPDVADATAAALRARVAAIESSVTDGPGRTGATLYIPTAGSTLSAYGPASMGQAQLEALGISNVFGDMDERVFEITREELLDRNPDVIVLLYGDDSIPEAAEQAIRDLPGADALTAVVDGNLVAQAFPYTDPPNPLSVTGLEHLAERLGAA